MAELNEVFIFNKDLHKTLPIEEGCMSIYGVRQSYIFSDNNNNANGNNNSRIFHRTTYNSSRA